MEQWEKDFVDAEEEGYVAFENGDFSQFHFGYVHGHMDCQFTTRDGKPAVEFSWEGNDEMDHAFGRGWVTVDGDQIEGMLSFHAGESSEFRAIRKRTKTRSHS